jgi:Zn-dependent M28 family amino/carboxypeptidase
VGLVGSAFFAQQAFNRKDSILGVVNLDMLGWDSNNDGLAEVHTRSTARSIELADTVLLVNQWYGIGLNPALRNPGTSASDHASFWQRGYSAVLLIEAYWGRVRCRKRRVLLQASGRRLLGNEEDAAAQMSGPPSPTTRET